MNWEICEIRNQSDIINAYIDSDKKRLNWDFVLGSPFELCAVFPWDGIMGLEDYHKKRERPYLYHRQFKNCRSLTYDNEPYTYALYPARMDRDTGVLYIGNSGCYLGASGKVKPKPVHIECFKKFFIFGSWPVKKYDSEIGQDKLYYRIVEKGKLMNTVYEADVAKGVCIHLKLRDDVRFFTDNRCTKEIDLSAQDI